MTLARLWVGSLDTHIGNFFSKQKTLLAVMTTTDSVKNGGDASLTHVHTQYQLKGSKRQNPAVSMEEEELKLRLPHLRNLKRTYQGGNPIWVRL